MPNNGEGERAVRVRAVSWRLAREQIGQDLRERYAVAQELPPRLLTLVEKLGAVEDNPSEAR